MPTEVRQIFFNVEEVKWALVEYARLKKNPVKLENITELTYNDAEKASVTLTVKHSENESVREVEFSNSDLAAAIIILARDIKLPLPHQGVKTLKAQKQILCLEVMREEKIDFGAITKMKLMMDITDYVK